MVLKPAALAAFFALLSASCAQAFFILSHPMLETTRLDPIVSPGKLAGHLHTIAGGSQFGDVIKDYAQSVSAKCTTAAVTVDKSNYWTPQLYYFDPVAETFSMIPVSFMNTYYLNRPHYAGEKVTAFPNGLRMLQGNPFRKDFNATNPDHTAVSFVCLDFNNDHSGDPEWQQLPHLHRVAGGCPSGMRAQVIFRSCWDGVNLDSPDHASHMAFPTPGPEFGPCPASHPIRVPTLFYEVIYDTNAFPFHPDAWVFSQGDTTGYGFHGDFTNGWDEPGGISILQAAIDDCDSDNGVGGVLENCAPFVPFLDHAAAQSCRPENPLVNEDIGDGGRSLPALPGNNPVTIRGKTYVSEAVPNGYKDPASVLPTDYSYVGCIAEPTGGRALEAVKYVNPAMTRGLCAAHCSGLGYAYAGVEYGEECYCDNILKNGADASKLLTTSQCGVVCPGLSTENCGGRSTLDLIVGKPEPVQSPKSIIPSGFTLMGCIAEGTSGRALKGAVFTSQSMNRGVCVSYCADKGYPLAGIEYGVECYCDYALQSGANDATLLDAANCGFTCPDKSVDETCGGSDALLLFSNPTLGPPEYILPTGWTYNSCRVEGRNGRALTGHTFTSNQMTRDLCINACASKGFTLAGVEYGEECYCGNEFANGGGAVAPEAECAKRCPGADSTYCGDGDRLSTFVVIKKAAGKRRRVNF